MVQMHLRGPHQQKGRALSCMDYGHHDPIHVHRVSSLQVVERPPQPPCDDDRKPGDDDGNPYTCHAERSEASLCLSRQTQSSRGGVTRCDCSNGQGLFFTIEPCLTIIMVVGQGVKSSSSMPRLLSPSSCQ